MSKIQSIKGMSDLLPGDSSTWQYLEGIIQRVFESYGYRLIRFPILEKTELFKRSIGEVTDIVEKEMYTFEDLDGTSVTLRPEGTAVCVRACEQNGLLHNQTQKLWYFGPMFRHEKPQKGRLRQFHQFGVEVFGFNGPDIDVEILAMTARLWRELGVSDHITLQINSIGSLESRNAYKAALVEYLTQFKDQLDEDSQRRLTTNPMRILDSKNSDTQALLSGAPDLFDYLDDDSKAHFDGLCGLLDALGISYEINQRLVRGLDYYNKTVFEWVTDKLGAQGTVCAGGRYDGLTKQLGGRGTPGVGFGMGAERLVLLLEELGLVPQGLDQQAQVYIVAAGDVGEYTFKLAEQLRDELPNLKTLTNCGGGSFKSQMKKADKSGADWALIVGENEVANNQVGFKSLREESEQEFLSIPDAVAKLQSLTQA